MTSILPSPDPQRKAAKATVDGPMIGAASKHKHRMEALMRRYHERGDTLASLCGANYFNRAIKTMQKYARKFGLAFPDYTPNKIKRKRALQIAGRRRRSK